MVSYIFTLFIIYVLDINYIYFIFIYIFKIHVSLCCLGDSGGPLVTLKDDRYTLVGVTSWGLVCSKKDTPGAFTDVAKSMAWINNVMGK